MILLGSKLHRRVAKCYGGNVRFYGCAVQYVEFCWVFFSSVVLFQPKLSLDFL